MPGTLYLGRIPHGFYEKQLKAYFEQFGDVEKVRLARNKKVRVNESPPSVRREPCRTCYV